MIQSGSTGVVAAEQLRGVLGPEGWNAVLDDIRAGLRADMVDGEVRFPGCMWLVRATVAA